MSSETLTSKIEIKEEPLGYEEMQYFVDGSEDCLLTSEIKVEDTKLECLPETPKKENNNILGPKYTHVQPNIWFSDTKQEIEETDNETKETVEDLMSLIRPCSVVLKRIQITTPKPPPPPVTTTNTTPIPQQKYSEEQLQSAIQAVESKKRNIASAARFYHIPRSTLRKRIHAKKRVPVPGSAYAPCIPDFIEEELVKYCIEFVKLGLPLLPKDLIDVVEKIIKLDQFKDMIRPFKNGKPSRSWTQRFFQRHPEIKMVDVRNSTKQQNNESNTSESDDSDHEIEPEKKKKVAVKTKINKTKKTTKTKAKVARVRKTKEPIRKFLEIHQCQACKATFNCAGALDVHNLNYHNETNRQFKCPKCSYAAITKGNLSMHLINIHSNVTFFCDICGHKTNSRRNVYCHMIKRHFKIKKKKYNRRFD